MYSISFFLSLSFSLLTTIFTVPCFLLLLYGIKLHCCVDNNLLQKRLIKRHSNYCALHRKVWRMRRQNVDNPVSTEVWVINYWPRGRSTKKKSNFQSIMERVGSKSWWTLVGFDPFESKRKKIEMSKYQSVSQL